MCLCYEHLKQPLLSWCLGFDLVEVKSDEVVIKAGKQANRRMLHFAMQALVAIFGKYTSELVTIYFAQEREMHVHFNTIGEDILLCFERFFFLWHFCR